MNKSRNGCGWECCPSGFREHWKCSFYLRDVAGLSLFGYWWHEFKSLIGFNRAPDEEETPDDN